MSKENLERILDQANKADWEIASQAWFRYQSICGTIAKNCGYPLPVGCAVFAALSPNSDYLGNIRDCGRVLAAARKGWSIDDFKVSSYGNNKRKAWRIVHGENPLDLIVFPKTRNFFLNILNPNDPHPVTVDGHIINAWNNKRMKLSDANMRLKRGVYDQIAEDIRQIAVERRIIANIVQGLIWYCWKRLHRIRHSDQMEFWGVDYMAAGLGFQPEMVGTSGIAPETSRVSSECSALSYAPENKMVA